MLFFWACLWPPCRLLRSKTVYSMSGIRWPFLQGLGALPLTYSERKASSISSSLFAGLSQYHRRCSPVFRTGLVPTTAMAAQQESSLNSGGLFGSAPLLPSDFQRAKGLTDIYPKALRGGPHPAQIQQKFWIDSEGLSAVVVRQELPRCLGTIPSILLGRRNVRLSCSKALRVRNLLICQGRRGYLYTAIEPLSQVRRSLSRAAPAKKNGNT